MTRDARFLQQLESYLDNYEGATTLPERVRDAVRAELPKTKQAGALRGPARNLTMFSTRTAQVALGLAAVALIVAVGASLYSGQNVGSPDGAASPSASTSAAAPCDATTVNSSGPGGSELHVVWCAHGIGEDDTIAFTMDESFGVGQDQTFPGAGILWLRPPAGSAIILVLYEGQSVDEVVTEVTGRDGYDSTDPVVAILDGAAGITLDLRLAEGSASDDVEPLFWDPGEQQGWPLQEGTFTRVWVVDVNGDAVMFAAGAEIADAVGDALESLEWER